MTTNDSSSADLTPPNPYADEARERWGHTDAYKQSRERVKKMTKQDWEKISVESDALMKSITALAEAGADPASPDVQALIAKHYAGLRAFYEPNVEMYRGLAAMYADDARFAAHYDKYRAGLAVFMRDAMLAFCDAQSTRK